MQNTRGHFGSKIGVVLASAGSAVGMGNIWRFPTETAENGGAAFVLIYLICVAVVGVPLMVSEFVVGRHTHTNNATAFKKLAPGALWQVEGARGVLVSFLITCFYIVISGWTLYYAYASLVGLLSDADRDYDAFFNEFQSNPWQQVICTTLFLAIVTWIITRGVKSGIERFSKLMMPMLLLIIGVLVVCSFSLPGSSEGMSYLLHPDFSKLSGTMVLAAFGQAFFSLSLAMGNLSTYASYFRDDTNLNKTAWSVAIIDTMVALLAGLIIFPAVFSLPNPDPSQSGVGLVFKTLPYVFTQAFGGISWLGYVFSLLFYLLLFLAALTSAMSTHEPVTAWLHETHHISRRRATLIVTAVCLFFGIICSLQPSLLHDVPLLSLVSIDSLDTLTSTFMMPIGGIVISIFVGWKLDRQLVRDEMTNYGRLRFRLFGVYIFLLRWVIPPSIATVFVLQFV